MAYRAELYFCAPDIQPSSVIVARANASLTPPMVEFRCDANRDLSMRTTSPLLGSVGGLYPISSQEREMGAMCKLFEMKRADAKFHGVSGSFRGRAIINASCVVRVIAPISFRSCPEISQSQSQPTFCRIDSDGLSTATPCMGRPETCHDSSLL